VIVALQPVSGRLHDRDDVLGAHAHLRRRARGVVGVVLAKIDDHYAATGLEPIRDGLEVGLGIGEVMKHVAHEHEIHGRGQAWIVGLGLHGLEIGEPFLLRALGKPRDHVGFDVDRVDLALRSRSSEAHREVTGARAEIGDHGIGCEGEARNDRVGFLPGRALGRFELRGPLLGVIEAVALVAMLVDAVTVTVIVMTVMIVLGFVGHGLLVGFGTSDAHHEAGERHDTKKRLAHGVAHHRLVRMRIARATLASLLIACAAQAEVPGVIAATPLEVAQPEPPASPEPVPLVEISAAAMEPVPVAPPPEPPPFDADQLERILAVQEIVAAAASQHGVEPALVNGLIWVESKFDARAKGPGGSLGLMQLMPKTATAMAKQLGRKRASYDPDFNIHAGTLLLSRLLDRFDGDVNLALAAYNRGAGTVAGWVEAGEPLPERTQAFVDRVLRARAWFEQPLPIPHQD
jgi:hypothetical protein